VNDFIIRRNHLLNLRDLESVNVNLREEVARPYLVNMGFQKPDNGGVHVQLFREFFALVVPVLVEHGLQATLLCGGDVEIDQDAEGEHHLRAGMDASTDGDFLDALPGEVDPEPLVEDLCHHGIPLLRG